MNKKVLFFSLFSVLGLFSASIASQAHNPRSGATLNTRQEISEKKSIKRGEETNNSRSAVKRNTSARSATTKSSVGRSAKQVVSGVSRPEISARAGNVNGTARTAVVRSGSVVSATNLSRAAATRATAVFNDVSKMGGTYGQCRDSYNTCMDQICANANDTYRRCYCSDKFTEFRDMESSLDTATTLLAKFQDNNLNAVDKTAAEVSAMYSATVGEAAIKKDTSGAADTLAQIGDLLSGKKSATAKKQVSTLSLDFSADMGDIWGSSGGSDSLFGGGEEDMTKLEGKALYSSADKQCSELVKSSCESGPALNMTKSAYNILIGQDCNAYEKKIDTKKEAVMKTVREAEKILRDARLEEYKSHNSADVNECIGKVKTAINQDTACGDKYKKCLDYTGLYVNADTGEAVFSAHLQDLPKIIQLDDANGNVIQANPKFSKYLDDKRMFAEKALDSCRDKAEVVWTEFKRTAIIEIAQAQDEKIEEVKSSCIDIMKSCYDTTSGGLASFDNSKSQNSAALGAYASRDMCADKVAACASVYAGPNDPVCEFDKSTGKLLNTKCGLSALLGFVQNVDNAKVAEGCKDGLDKYIQDLCQPATGDSAHKWPWGCRLRSKDTIVSSIESFALTNCSDPSKTYANYSALATDMPNIKEMIDSTVSSLGQELGAQLRTECIAVTSGGKGVWDSTGYTIGNDKTKPFSIHPEWLSKVFGGTDLNILAATGINGYTIEIENGNGGFVSKKTTGSGSDSLGWGVCVRKSTEQMCTSQNSIAGFTDTTEFNSTAKTCTLKDAWFTKKCEQIGGYYESGVCYAKP